MGVCQSLRAADVLLKEKQALDKTLDKMHPTKSFQGVEKNFRRNPQPPRVISMPCFQVPGWDKPGD